MLKAENKDLLEKQTVGDIKGEENDQYSKTKLVNYFKKMKNWQLKMLNLNLILMI